MEKAFIYQLGLTLKIMLESKLKHLEFLQNIITRMNSNSFLIKSWTVTLVCAVYALASKEANSNYIGITYLATIIFWGLDGYYLSVERQYRGLYNDIAIKDEEHINFSMDASNYNGENNNWASCVVSRTTWPLYVIILLVSASIMFF